MKKTLIIPFLLIFSLFLSGCQMETQKVELCTWYRDYFTYTEMITHNGDSVQNIIRIETEASNVISSNTDFNKGVEKYLNEVDGIKVTTQVDNEFNHVQTYKYDFNEIDLDEYVNAVKKMNDDKNYGVAFEDPAEYIVDNYVSYSKYKELNLQEYTCNTINE